MYHAETSLKLRRRIVAREGKNYTRKSGHGEKDIITNIAIIYKVHGYRRNVASLRNHNCSLQITLSVVLNMDKNMAGSNLGTTQK